MTKCICKASRCDADKKCKVCIPFVTPYQTCLYSSTCLVDSGVRDKDK